MSTTKRQIDDEITAVEVLCGLAATSIRSFMPRALGEFHCREDDELQQMLKHVTRRWKKAIRKAQKTGWAGK